MSWKAHQIRIFENLQYLDSISKKPTASKSCEMSFNISFEYDSKHRSSYGYLDAVAIKPLAQECYKIIAWGGRIRLHVFEHFGVGQQFETIFKHKAHHHYAKLFFGAIEEGRISNFRLGNCWL